MPIRKKGASNEKQNHTHNSSGPRGDTHGHGARDGAAVGHVRPHAIDGAVLALALGCLARISCGAGYRAGMPTALKQKAQSRTKSILSHYGSATTDQALSVMKEGATLQVQGKTSSLTPAHLPEGERQVRALHLHAGQ